MKKLFLSSLLATSIFAFAYTQTDVSNAKYLADNNIITAQSDETKYRLDDTISRAEVVAIALKIKGIKDPSSYKCKKYYSDTVQNDWICRAVEMAADNGLVSRGNTKFRPQDKITRAESLAILINASGEYEVPPIGGPLFVDTNNWQYALMLKTSIYFPEILTNIYTDTAPGCEMEPCTRYYFNPNRPATRAEVFGFARNILLKSTNANQQYEGFTADFEGQNVQRSTYEQDINYTFGKGGEIEGSYAQEFSIHLEPADSLVYFDSGEKIEQKDWNGHTYYATMVSGMCYGGKLVFIGEKNIITASGVCNQTIREVENALKTIGFMPQNNTRKMKDSDVLKAYYMLLNYSSNVDQAFDMRLPAGVARTTFQSWYKNIAAVKFREDTIKDLGNNTYEFLVDMTENGGKSTYRVKSKVNVENFTIENISSVKI